MNRQSNIIVFCALAVAMTASWAARANSIFLTCPGLYPTAAVTVDLTNSTVNNYPAKINTTSIDWREGPEPSNGMSMTRVRHIDRIAATVMGYTQFEKQGEIQGSSGTTTQRCTVGTAPPTKF
jgi:hypothetical protein